MNKEPNNMTNSPITYKDSGVNIHEGNKLVSEISDITKATSIKGATGELGGFGGLFDLKKTGFKESTRGPFFRKGKVGDWKNELNEELKIKIEKAF